MVNSSAPGKVDTPPVPCRGEARDSTSHQCQQEGERAGGNKRQVEPPGSWIQGEVGLCGAKGLEAGGGAKAGYGSHNEIVQVRTNTLSWGVTEDMRCSAKENLHERALKSESARHPCMMLSL